MPRLRFPLLCWSVCLALAGQGAPPAGAGALLVLTGDQHSAYARTAQFVGLIDRLRQENPSLPVAVLLDGDTLEYGNALARRSRGAVDFAQFAALASRVPTVLNLGNHEPEFYDLAETVRRIAATGVQVVGNLTDHATGRPFAPASLVLPLGGENLVIIGLTTDRLSTYRVAVRPALDLADPVVWAQTHFPQLLAPPAAKGPATLRPIILSHAGLAADRDILPLVPDGTLFAGAHDHLRLVQPFGRTVYVHSGAWNEFVTLAWLCRAPAGAPVWIVEQQPVPTEGPGAAEIVAALAQARKEFGAPEDTAIVGHLPQALPPSEAARFAVRTLRRAAGVDAAFVGNTTFGGGLPAGDITALDFDACVRFDGAVFTAEVDGARLAALLAASNQGPDTPFAQRRGEFNYADGPAAPDPARRYRIATTDWGAKNTARCFGPPDLAWQELPGLKLKAAVVRCLQARRE